MGNGESWSLELELESGMVDSFCYVFLAAKAGSSFRGSQKIGEKGGVERKLSLGLVRSFFALSIKDNIRYFSHNRRDSGARD